MKQVGSGDTVKVHYTGKLEDGVVFDSSRDRDPLEFTLGKGQMIKGFEGVVAGMSIGDSTTVTIPFKEAYGERRDELVINVPRGQFPHNIEAEEGVLLSIRQPDGGVMEVTITNVAEDSVTLDANHPLAGKDLTFDIEVVEVIE